LSSVQRLLRLDEAAVLFNVKPRTMNEWVRADLIPYVRLGDGPRAPIRFDPDELGAWLDQHRFGIDVGAARQYLRESLPAGAPVEIENAGVLDAAAAVVVRTKAAPQ
jgi:hypothetical protein